MTEVNTRRRHSLLKINNRGKIRRSRLEKVSCLGSSVQQEGTAAREQRLDFKLLAVCINGQHGSPTWHTIRYFPKLIRGIKVPPESTLLRNGGQPPRKWVFNFFSFTLLFNNPCFDISAYETKEQTK